MRRRLYWQQTEKDGTSVIAGRFSGQKVLKTVKTSLSS